MSGLLPAFPVDLCSEELEGVRRVSRKVKCRVASKANPHRRKVLTEERRLDDHSGCWKQDFLA